MIMPASRWPPGAMARGGARQGPTTAIGILTIADVESCLCQELLMLTSTDVES